MAMRLKKTSRSAVLVSLLVIALTLSLAESISPAQAPPAERYWKDLVHGIKVTRLELVRSNAQALLEESVPARQLYLLSAQTPDVQYLFERGRRLEGIADLIDKLAKKIEDGFLSERSDPEQIASAIDMLSRSTRAYELGASRLAQSGEYAMPQLVQRLIDPSTSLLVRERIITVLPRLGREAIAPLAMVLRSEDQQLIQIAAAALGQMGYPTAAPYLKELLERQDLLEQTRQVVLAAVISTAGKSALEKTAACLFYELAEKYYYQAESVMPTEQTLKANVWYWRKNMGLDFYTVVREIFPDICAMRLSRRALELDPNYYPAVSLWLSAKIRRQVNLPPGAVDPTTLADEPSAAFYALAGSARYLQDVLQRAIGDGAHEVAMEAIGALSQTAGAKNLIRAVEGGVQPLVAALSSTNRDVRYLAALTLANALPREQFTGQDMVVRVLNEMLRLTGGRRALVISGDEQLGNILSDALRTKGFEVIDRPTPEQALTDARKTSGIDLILAAGGPSPMQLHDTIRREPMLSSVPLLLVASQPVADGIARLPNTFVLVHEEPQATDVAQAVEQATQSSSDEITPEQARKWTILASEAIWLLGMTSNPVLDIGYTSQPLVELTGNPHADVILASARTLAVMPSSLAQQAVASVAVNQAVDKTVRIEVMDLLTGSLRRFGNNLTDEIADQFIAVVIESDEMELRESAAAVVGAMDLPSERIKDLILQTGQILAGK